MVRDSANYIYLPRPEVGSQKANFLMYSKKHNKVPQCKQSHSRVALTLALSIYYDKDTFRKPRKFDLLWAVQHRN